MRISRVLLLYFVFFYHIVFFAQKKQYDVVAQYKLEYKLDSLQKNHKVENFILMMNKEESAFISTIEFYRDSLLTHSNRPAREIMTKYRTENSFFIQTFLQSHSSTFSDRAGDAKFRYSESQKFDWKLENGIKTIGGILCNKATVDAFGRKWEAWYSKNHPFFFGPYKFFGLPGLIIEMFDATNSYHFTLFAIKKDKLLYEDIHKNSKLISKKEMLEVKKNSGQYYEVFRNITFDDPKVAKDIREGMEEKEKRKNNPIELL